MARNEGPGPLPAVVAGVVGALVLFWFVGVVISTAVFFVRIAVLVALVWGAFWIWGKLSRE